ncbi:hypothetical protein DHEL01_v205670 [Diaporthe helianthi]|uniref:Uncharacterized protein n=1 Tax=Diaporthe helianthi TaxID=158607 RepID=A0A2P5I0B2_DIAHE|nr:hypothetical protein DHEL01_v205670 [Diaporthe helianthi]
MKFENKLGHRVWGGRGVEQLSTEQASEQEESTANSNGGKSGSKRSRGGHGVDARVRLYGQVAQDSSFGRTGCWEVEGEGAGRAAPESESQSQSLVMSRDQTGQGYERFEKAKVLVGKRYVSEAGSAIRSKQ